MLVQFTVGNYRSFREKVTLSLVASSDKHLAANTFPVSAPGGPCLLKSAALYGANASGKSNLIRAMLFMRGFVLASASKSGPGEKIRVDPFRLDPETANEPSFFEMVFVTGGKRYVYGFEADSASVHSEWLTVAESAKPKTLFRRTSSESAGFGTSWSGERKRLVARTRPNALLLSVAAQFNNPIATLVYNWFETGIRGVSGPLEAGGEEAYTAQRFAEDESFRRPTVNLVRVAAPAIEQLEVQQRPLKEGEGWRLLRSRLSDEFLESLPDDLTEYEVSTRHRSVEGELVKFDMARDESAGTQRLFALAGPWDYLLREDCVLLVDEIEASLHPLLTRYLIENLHANEGPHQLVFATHDCGLLDPDLFRRDQIWFTEAKPSGATDVYSLADYQGVRATEDFRNRYLAGRYGAIPYIGEFRFGEEDQKER